MRYLPPCLRMSLSGAALAPLRRAAAARPTRPARPTPVLAVRSNDGKKRRSKTDKDAAAAAPAPQPPPAPAPPRVLPDILIPVRTQIRLVRAQQETAKRTSFRQTYKTPPNFRKEAKSPEEHRAEREAAEAAAAAAAAVESKSFALSRLYRTAQGAARLPPILLVDGYNVLHRWDRAAADMAAGDFDAARDKLLEAMCVYSQTNEMRVVVAFDAMGGPLGVTEERLLATGVTVAWCGDCEADSYIEDQVGVWLAKRHPYVVVATSDAAQKAVVDSKRGPDARQVVHVVPATGLCKDIEATERRAAQAMEDHRLRAGLAGVGRLGSAVRSQDRDVYSKLAAMRKELPPSPVHAAAAKLRPKGKREGGGGGGVPAAPQN